MSLRTRTWITTAAGVVTLILLVLLTWLDPPAPQTLVPGVVFFALIAFTMVFSVTLAGGAVSLMPLSVVAAVLALGRIPAAWAAYGAALAQGGYRLWRAIRAPESGEPRGARLLAVTAFNAAIHSLAALAVGTVYTLLDGPIPIAQVTLAALPRLLAAGLTYLAVNYVLAGLYLSLRGRAILQGYVSSIPNLLYYEGGPLVFAPLMALIYTQLGLAQFVVFVGLAVVASLIAHDLATASRRLERRVQELGSLQAVGQALSASLDIDTITAAIYKQAASMMAADNFYVALYDAELDEVSFPLAVEDGKRVTWRARKAGEGLTEFVLRRREPLLIAENLPARLDALGIARIGKDAACWLGVPILAGGEPLGIIAVQSLKDERVFDASHERILSTIASQAAVAIQNARLYARTDEALARRVQELDSILRTSRDGLLLMDLKWHVLAANPALAAFLDVAQGELVGQPLDALRTGGDPIITLIGYTPAHLRADCEMLLARVRAQEQAVVMLGNPGRHIERTLTPVADREGAFTGWLLVFRDITEEVELTRLRDDMTSMLIHDLRSPLTMVMGSLSLLNQTQPGSEEYETLMDIGKRSSERMLAMINQLLDISKLESGQLPLHRKPTRIEDLLKETVSRFAPLAAEANLSLSLSVDADLPEVELDPQLMGRVLHNLVDNAVKFTPDGGRIYLIAEGTVTQARIVVRDTGPGIPPEALSRIFEKFQRVETTEGRRPGTGLGLSFCRLVVEAHGGRIWAESELGQGAAFTLVLPLADGQTVDEASPSAGSDSSS